MRALATRPSDGDSAASVDVTLFSASRDGTARSWFRSVASADASDGMQVDGDHGGRNAQGGGAAWRPGVTFEGQHEGFVNACTWVAGDGESVRARGLDDRARMSPMGVQRAIYRPCLYMILT